MPHDDELAQRFHQLKAAMTPDEALLQRVDAAIAAEPPGTDAEPQSKPTHRRFRPSFGLGAVVGGVAGAVLAGALVLGLVTSGASQWGWLGPKVQSSGQPGRPPVVAAGPYAAIYKAVAQAMASTSSVAYASSDSAGGYGGGRAAPMPAPMGESGSVVSTNVQVAGIDEGDIVKTDGAYLYVAKGRAVDVVTADGAASRQVATIDVSSLKIGDELLVGPVTDLMIDGTTLVVLTHGFDADVAGWSSSNASYIGLSASRLKAVFFDISDPLHPQYVSQVAQSGSYIGSRLSDGVLYLVSSYWVNPDGVDQNDPATYVPTVISRGQVTVVKPADVTVTDGASQTVYTVVTAVDVAGQVVRSEQAVFGNMGTLYMSAQNLYLTANQWPVFIADGPAVPVPMPRGGGAFDGTKTDIVRVALNGGNLAVAAQGAVPGMVVDQFAMDELDGYLRVATTWTDPSNNNWVQNSALWVLDASLGVVGSIEKLATDESVQSVRFAGTIGYVVTYHQIDPLFTIDLTDPTAPKVQGALKIPGFSQYMQMFGDGLLLGIGVETDPQTGQSKGLKVTMFDVSDPYNVTEAATTIVAGDYTPVDFDHKAAFVDVEQGVVGFMGISWATQPTTPDKSIIYAYHVFRWTGQQFDEITSIPVSYDAMPPWDNGSTTRGIRIGQSFYLTTRNTVQVYETSGFSQLTSVSLA